MVKFLRAVSCIPLKHNDCLQSSSTTVRKFWYKKQGGCFLYPEIPHRQIVGKRPLRVQAITYGGLVCGIIFIFVFNELE